ncbi:MAG: gamma-glutamyl-gamma-aminobutyrate hydrolase family protein [Syntrophomonadaceae bacterium]|nr:gamma-glutamyl-gamma-aminobutyrate hydrolase family protein [Syntrophomonadaceae bacterium]MDD3022620.1 gamma-glutamyl-gamma-aminobutyrate hydrolase family protein [Syntrophomonadaceae bacterium]
MQPIIGITANYSSSEKTYCLREAYALAVQKAGGTAIILPPIENEEIIKDYLTVCNGFILSGGGDIDPVYWGQLPQYGLLEINPLRDCFELLLTREILEHKLAVLGICRGCQLLNVSMGGSLVQDINSNLNHEQKAPRDYAFHDIFIDRKSYLANILHNESIRVNSFHHQAIDEVGFKMRAVAYAPDGTVEAIESQETSFALGVQWHPEWLSDEHSDQLFRALVEAAVTAKRTGI